MCMDFLTFIVLAKASKSFNLLYLNALDAHILKKVTACSVELKKRTSALSAQHMFVSAIKKLED